MHTLLKIGEGWKCSVCGQTWKAKPRSECPGVVVYEWGKQPATLVFQRDLFPKGLKLAEGQRHRGITGSNHYRLYDINEAVPHGLAIDFGNSKYAFLDTDDGFDIYRVCGTKVSVRYVDTYIKMWINDEKWWRYSAGLYDFKKIVNHIAELFVLVILPNARKSESEEAEEMIARALTGRFKTHWRRIITQIVPKEVEHLARLMWSSALSDTEVLHYPELYQEEHAFLYRDLIQYHAARLAVLGLRASASANNHVLAATLEPVNYRQVILKELRDWRKTFTPTVPYKALNKTLDKLPVGISPSQIGRLSVMHLEQPITSRLHLSFALCAAEHHNWGLHERTVLTASDALIKQVSQEFRFGRPLTARSTLREIGNLATVLLDYPQAVRGDLMALADASERWHGEVATKIERGLSDDHPLPMPTGVDLDALTEQGITILKTAGECYDEGKRMKHCVGSYASKAAEGMCYLFHVEHEGQRATVEMSPLGIALQAYGPTNTTNAACEFGTKTLREAFVKTKAFRAASKVGAKYES